MKLIKGLCIIIISSLLSIGIVGTAMAGGAEIYQAKVCFSCHGPDGKTPLSPEFPRLAGQNADYAFNQMRDIKSGARNNGQTAAMKGIMVAVSDEEMREIATWLRSLRDW